MKSLCFATLIYYSQSSADEEQLIKHHCFRKAIKMNGNVVLQLGTLTALFTMKAVLVSVCSAKCSNTTQEQFPSKRMLKA